MTTTLFTPTSSRASRLHIERTGLRFRNVTPDLVRIEFELENRGSNASRPEMLSVNAARFGAFVPSEPLATVVAPELAAGETATIAFDAPVGFAGRPAPRQPTVERAGAGFVALRGALPLGLMRERKIGGVHWIGNIEIFARRQRLVERHCAREIPVHRGVPAFAIFEVGQGDDAYAMTFEGPAASWDLSLSAPKRPRLVPDRRGADVVAEGDWLETSGTRLVLLHLTPPRNVERSTLDIRVRERSTNREALVEFEFTPVA